MTDWRDRAARRTASALSSAGTISDRLSLMRTLAWLEGGRTSLSSSGMALTPQDKEALFRFGLRTAGEDDTVRLLAGSPYSWWPDIHVEAADRRGWTEAVPDGVLRRFTDKHAYRNASQKAAVRALLTQPGGSGLMVSMPTGAGKSLLFQLAALQGRGRTGGGSCVIVITPTIALALDHERALTSMLGLEGSRALTGDLPAATSRAIIDAFRRGEVPVLFVSPEKALQDSVIAQLIEAASPEAAFAGLDARMTHLFVDEAHIVEAWGRSFRPDFQRLPGLLVRLRNANPDVRLVLLSATLTPAAKRVLREGWRLQGEWLELDARVPRLEHDVMVADFDRVEDRDAALDWVVDHAPRPAIVYTTEVAAAEALHERLTDVRGYRRVAVFTGATASAARRDVIRRWADDELDIVVATSAFGMGIDKSNVRSVIHACIPEGPARWYQEIGRAARDGGQAFSVTLFTDTAERNDVDRAFDIATSGWLSVDLGKSRWEAMLRSATNLGWTDGRFGMSVDLDALRDGLGPVSGDYNRGWNMALLTLMQRAGSIAIASVEAEGDQPTGTWNVMVIDPSLLEGSASLSWRRIFEVREQERRDAASEVTPFFELMRSPGGSCVTRTVFEMIEPGSFAPPCGRCPACRSNAVPPPSAIASLGLETVWKPVTPYSGPLPIGLILLEPSDSTLTVGLRALLTRLAKAGVQQFVVSAEMAAEAAGILGETDRGLGLVMSHEDWTGDVRLANIATALLLPDPDGAASAMASRFLEWNGTAGGVPAVLVGRRERIVSGRRLDQFASPHAPIGEAVLDAWPQS